MTADRSLFAFGFTHHRKVRRLSDVAFRLWVTAIDHANQDRSGGLVDSVDIDCYPRVPRGDERDRAIGELVDLGLWDEFDGGWVIHDFDEWQSRPAEHQPAGPANASRTPAGTASQLGGVARAAGAKRGPGGRFGPSRTPAEHQPALQPNDQLNDQPAGHGGDLPSPPVPLSGHQEGEDLEKTEQSGSGTSDPPTKSGSGRARRRTQLPASWSPNEDHAARARSAGLDLAGELERFRLHAEGTGRLMVNWNAAFTTWLINAPKFAPRGPRAAHRPVQPSHNADGYENADIVRPGG